LDAGAGRLNWRVLYRWVTYRIVTTESNRNGTEENLASSYENDNVSNFFFYALPYFSLVIFLYFKLICSTLVAT
jgi:hypothetical protein